MKIFLSILFLFLTISHAKIVLIKNSNKLYLYEAPHQDANKTKLYKNIGDTLTIQGCNKYDWCKTEGGYVKKMFLDDKIHHDKKKYFLTSSIGYTHTKVKQNNEFGTISLANAPDEKGYNLNLGVGYNYSQKIFFVLNYQSAYFDDVDLHNFYLSANYRFDKIQKIYPYVGALAGYSRLHWKRNPIPSSNKDTISGSYIAGMITGFTYPIDERWFLDINYQLYYTDHKTNIISSPAKSTLRHKQSQTINIGLRWIF